MNLRPRIPRMGFNPTSILKEFPVNESFEQLKGEVEDQVKAATGGLDVTEN